MYDYEGYSFSMLRTGSVGTACARVVQELDKTADHVAERRSIALHGALRDLGLHDHGTQKSPRTDPANRSLCLWE